VGLIAAIMAMGGCGTPAAEESQNLTHAAAPSAAPTPTTTFPLTAAPTPGLAFAPDGFLPPNSLVEVKVDTLQLRGGPGLSEEILGIASAGETFRVSWTFGPVVANGLDWYMLPNPSGSDLCAAVGSGADRYLDVVPPDCPAADLDLATLTGMANDWDRLACFGDQSLTFVGTFGCAGCGGTWVGDFAPQWLAYPISGYLLWPDYPQSGSSVLQIRVAADSGLKVPADGSIVRVTGHFSDPASTTCSMSTFDGELARAVDPMTAELYCREQFVVDAFEVIGTDPDFP